MAAQLIQIPEPFVADLVVVNREFPEVAAIGVLDDSVPAAGQILAGPGIQVYRSFRFDDDGAEEAMGGLFPVVTVAVEVVGSFRLVLLHHPPVGHGCAGLSYGIMIGGYRRGPGVFHIEAGAMEVQAGRFTVIHAVAQRQPQTFALINPQRQGLDSVAL